MKKLALLMFAAFIACLLQACHSRTDSASGGEGDTTNITADTAKHAEIIIDKNDSKFVTDIAEACIAEIKVGNMAKQKGHDKRIKNFGAMMIKDLTKGKTKLATLAKTKKIALPDSISTDDQKEIDDLAKKSGKDFDSAYLNKTRADHKKALELFQNAAAHAYDKDIKSFAGKNMPNLKRHLDAIDAIQGSMK